MRKYFLKSGYIFLAVEPTIITAVIGSCVAVSLFCRERRMGGMAHFVTSQVVFKHKPTALYARPAITQLIRMFRLWKLESGVLEAHIFGGATSLECTPGQRSIGPGNITAAKEILTEYRINIIGEDTGGYYGRKIGFNSATGEIIIVKVEHIRHEDWYPRITG